MNANEIRTKFSGIGTMAGELYTKQEAVDRLKAFQAALAHEICGVDDGSMRSSDISQSVEEKALALGLQNSKNLEVFKLDMQNLGCEIGLTIAGMRGERTGFRALKPLKYDDSTYVLQNVCLAEDDERSEIDGLVISPYGIFIIEMKNWRGDVVVTENGFLQKASSPDCRYSLGERMCRKELLVRAALEENPGVPVYPILLFVNNASVDDRFREVPIANCNTIAYMVRSHAHKVPLLTRDQVSGLVTKIEARHEEERYPCSVDCGQIVENLAILMEEMEAAEQAKDTRVDRASAINAAQAKLVDFIRTNKPLQCDDAHLGAAFKNTAAGVAGLVTTALRSVALSSLKTTR